MTKNIKKYEIPEMKVIEMETAPLLAGSGVNAGGESGNITGDIDE